VLVCLVSDPNQWIQNPRGIEHDLTRTHDGLEVRLMIVQT
jgi:hypothetical protein